MSESFKNPIRKIDPNENHLIMGNPDIARYLPNSNRESFAVETSRTLVFRVNQGGTLQVYMQIKRNGTIEFPGGKTDGLPPYIAAINELGEETSVKADKLLAGKSEFPDGFAQYGSQSPFRNVDAAKGSFLYENPYNEKVTKVNLFSILVDYEESKRMNHLKALPEDNLVDSFWIGWEDLQTCIREHDGLIEIDRKCYKVSGNSIVPPEMLEE